MLSLTYVLNRVLKSHIVNDTAGTSVIRVLYLPRNQLRWVLPNNCLELFAPYSLS